MIASEVQDVFSQHNMVAVYHYNSLSASEWNSLRCRLAISGLRVKIFPSKISMKALKDTIYCNIAPLFRGPTAVAFAKDSAAINDLVAVTRAEPKLHLLGGLVEDVIMSPLRLQKYADLPPLEVLQQEVVNTLNRVPLTLIQYLEGNQRKLLRLLEQRAQGEEHDQGASGDQ